MLHRQLDRMHAFFQRPGVTPARVAPWVALAILIPAFFIGSKLEPLGQQRASSDDGSLVVAGGGQATPPAAAAGSTAGANDSGDTASGDASPGEPAADDAADDSGAPFEEPVPEPAFVEPAADLPAAETPAGEEEAADDVPADAQSYEGVVVHRNKRADSYTIATADQDLLAIHAEKLPDAGASIRTQVTALANGTWNEVGEREDIDTASSAQFRGWITWAAGDGLSYTVSARGVSMVVTRPEGGDPLPAGAPVSVAVEIDPRTAALTQTSFTAEGERTDTPVNVAGIVRSVDVAERRLRLSADDLGASYAELDLAVPDPAIDLRRVDEADVLSVTAIIGADATYTLTGLAADGGAKAADDTKLAQGDQVEAEDPEATGKLVDELLRSLGIL